MAFKKMASAQQLLASSLTFREAPLRSQVLPDTFSSAEESVARWTEVLLHEARESMQEPLSDPPVTPYLHPVDVDTEEPGIVHTKEGCEVLRCAADTTPRVRYGGLTKARKGSSSKPLTPSSEVLATISKSMDEAREEAESHLGKALQRAQRSAAAAERAVARRQEKKEERARETPGEREERLRGDREKRQKRKIAKEAEVGSLVPVPKAVTAVQDSCPEEEGDVDLSASAVWKKPPRRRRDASKLHFFAHPLPHHRHLTALELSAPHPDLEPALIRGTPCEGLRILQGPPGTGKTSALVALLSSMPQDVRVLLAAPTNVGAANLYARCLADGWGEECALSLSPDRIPPGSLVLSDDPARRLVCATVSGRSGPRLNHQAFDAVFLDEAAQCMEAWTWTLLRPEVRILRLAGDVKQLPACVSETGLQLHHERSLMERLLLCLKYPLVDSLEVQHRMAPEILSYPNRAFYHGELSCGTGAPELGSVEWLRTTDGVERASGTSVANSAEARAAAERAAELKRNGADVVMLTPYAAQVHLLLSHASNCEVHTLDSFQGREADVVVLSTVRDGSAGLGFWEDPRRLTVALTRARRRLLVIFSGTWPEASVLGRWKASEAPEV